MRFANFKAIHQLLGNNTHGPYKLGSISPPVAGNIGLSGHFLT